MVLPTHALDDVGFIAGRQFDVVVLPKTAGAPIAKGDVIALDPAVDAYRTAPAGAATLGPFAVAVKPALAGDATVEAVSSGAVTVRADGPIGYEALVVISGATAGQVVEYVATATTATYTAAEGAALRDESFRIVGKYIGKVGDNTRNGMGGFPDAADNDVIIVDLNRRTS